MLNVECYVSRIVNIFRKRLAIEVREYLDWQTIPAKKSVCPDLENPISYFSF